MGVDLFLSPSIAYLNEKKPVSTIRALTKTAYENILSIIAYQNKFKM